MSDTIREATEGDPVSIIRRMILIERRRMNVLGEDPYQAFLWGNDLEKALNGEEPHWLAHMEETMPPMHPNTEKKFAHA